MPTYKYVPKNNDPALTRIFNQFVDPSSEFTTPYYLTSKQMMDLSAEFVKDEPYITPIVFSEIIEDSTKREFNISDDENNIFDIYVNILNNACGEVSLVMNNDEDNKIVITEKNSGLILRRMHGRNIRIISVKSETDGKYQVYANAVQFGFPTDFRLS